MPAWKLRGTRCSARRRFAAGAAVGVFLGGNQLVITEAEDAGVAMVNEGGGPGTTKTVADQELRTCLLKDVLVAVIEFDFIAILAVLDHLLELAASVVNALTEAAEAA